jgi:hypothetical protein
MHLCGFAQTFRVCAYKCVRVAVHVYAHVCHCMKCCLQPTVLEGSVLVRETQQWYQRDRCVFSVALNHGL